MRSKELSMQVKQAILRLRKQKKPIREIAAILGVAKSTVWYILRKKESTGELINAKRPGNPQKTTVVDDRRIISMVKRNPFTTANQVNNTLQELADIVIDSLCRGVFAGDSRQLSLRSCFPFLYEAERHKRSVVLGMVATGDKTPPLDSPLIHRSKKEKWSQWSLRGGMQTLSDTLEAYIKDRGVQIHKDTPVEALHWQADGGWQIKVPGGSMAADHVISAVPAAVLSKVLPLNTEPMTNTLREMSAATVAVVNLEYDGDVLPVSGFGHLIPSFEGDAMLGIVYDSLAFPEHNRRGGSSTRLTVMLGGAWFESSLGDPDAVSKEVLLSLASTAAATQLGVKETPCRTIVTLNKSCIPQYTLGHWKRIDHLFSYIRQHSLPLSLVGASYEGVSVNDCIYNARKSVKRLLGC
ncbi:unnamed protein product [Ranitomeya imitator]|uniref:Protoporphyrinogen oxidase n=1 Tax=Ranitomeya imitator TaxID=111125 RepID=A0ABN9LCT1_9NEOB|nr:unnamed protein product [Ranitomeya imitator]